MGTGRVCSLVGRLAPRSASVGSCPLAVEGAAEGVASERPPPPVRPCHGPVALAFREQRTLRGGPPLHRRRCSSKPASLARDGHWNGRLTEVVAAQLAPRLRPLLGGASGP